MVPNNLVPYIARVAIGTSEKVRVFGNDYDTVDGTGVRDYIHVCDLADGHIAAVKYALEHKGVEKVNLGTGNGYSVLQVIARHVVETYHMKSYHVEQEMLRNAMLIQQRH